MPALAPVMKTFTARRSGIPWLLGLGTFGACFRDQRIERCGHRGMTADAVSIPTALLEEMVAQLMQLEGICAVFCDLTNKPPGTIEWE